jgi:hypothetical protein
MQTRATRSVILQTIVAIVTIAAALGLQGPPATAQAQLMAWAILPRDDEIPAGYTFSPERSQVFGNGSAVYKTYSGAYGNGWQFSADLNPTPQMGVNDYLSTRQLLGTQYRMTITDVPDIGHGAFMGEKMVDADHKLVSLCFIVSRWVGCVTQVFPPGRGDPETHGRILGLMVSRAYSFS